MKVLLLEDEYALRISIEEFLTDIGYDVESFSNGDAAYDAVYEHHYDILLLDVNVPGMSGFELLDTLRRDGKKISTIFITSMTEIQNLEEGYKKGCCDYIRKPFDLSELQLRLMQVCKTVLHEDDEILTLSDDLTYNIRQFTLTYQGKEIILSRTEKDIFSLLLKYQNQVVSLMTFQDEIWGEYMDPANIRVQINNLRKKLPEGIIQNRRGLGYLIER